MLLLAIDASSKETTVAVIREGTVLAVVDLNQFSAHLSSSGGSGSEKTAVSDRKHGKHALGPGPSALLTPMIQSVLERSSVSINDLELVAFSIGPGLFTGLRVGVVTAKALAFARNIPVIGVNTLEVIAARAALSDPDHKGPIDVAINAQRQQLFTGRFQSSSAWTVESLGETQLEDRGLWLDGLKSGALVSGSGLRLFRPDVEQRVASDDSIRLADENFWNCDATSVGHVAAAHFAAGRRDDHWSLEPLYFRPSAAEEVLLAKTAEQ